MKSTNQSEVQAYVLNRIRATRVETTPFPHCFVENIFPESFYVDLLNKLPNDEVYERSRPPYEQRLFINFNEGKAAKMGEFWEEFERWINGQYFLDGVVSHFGNLIQGAYEYRKEQVKFNTSKDRVKIGVYTKITRDYAHYSIGPHTDGAQKFVTALFYLPKDKAMSSFGTSVYAPKKQGFSDFNSTHFPYDQFNLVKTFPYQPNSALFFVKTENSFHGVEPSHYPNTGRNMIIWHPELGQSSQEDSGLSLSLDVFQPKKKTWRIFA